MKFNAILSIARQIEGEVCFVRIIKASTNSDKLHRFLRETDLPRTVKMGDVECFIEYGVIENIEVEDIWNLYLLLLLRSQHVLAPFLFYVRKFDTRII